MVEVDPQTPLIGADGTVPLIDIFDGRSQLIAYFHMWHTGRPAGEHCEGCTLNTSHITELAYLHSRGGQFRQDGRPTAQRSRMPAGRDDLGVMQDGWTACSCSLHTGPPAAPTN